MMTKMISLALFAFDENKKMLGRVQAQELIKSDEFDPDWITTDEVRAAFTQGLKATQPYPQHCFALLENVEVSEVAA